MKIWNLESLFLLLAKSRDLLLAAVLKSMQSSSLCLCLFLFLALGGASSFLLTATTQRSSFGVKHLLPRTSCSSLLSSADDLEEDIKKVADLLMGRQEARRKKEEEERKKEEEEK